MSKITNAIFKLKGRATGKITTSFSVSSLSGRPRRRTSHWSLMIWWFSWFDCRLAFPFHQTKRCQSPPAPWTVLRCPSSVSYVDRIDTLLSSEAEGVLFLPRKCPRLWQDRTDQYPRAGNPGDLRPTWLRGSRTQPPGRGIGSVWLGGFSWRQRTSLLGE